VTFSLEYAVNLMRKARNVAKNPTEKKTIFKLEKNANEKSSSCFKYVANRKKIKVDMKLCKRTSTDILLYFDNFQCKLIFSCTKATKICNLLSSGLF